MKTNLTIAVLACLLCNCDNKAKTSAGEKSNSPSVGSPVETVVKNVSAEEARKLLSEAKAGELTVIDVRTPSEFAGGHLADAINIDFNAADFETQLSKLDKGGKYLVHCRSGGRSTKSLEVFKKLKFSSVTHLDGGMMAWEEVGGAVKK